MKRRIIIVTGLSIVVALLIAAINIMYIPKGSVLVIKVSGSFPETVPADAIGQLLMGERPTLMDLLMAIRKAGADKRIAAVIIRIGATDMGYGKVQEVREAIAEYRKSGKPIYAYLESEGGAKTKEYYLAAACDKIFSHVCAVMPLNGIMVREYHLAAVWEKIGVEIIMPRAFEYKSVPDMILRKDISPQQMEVDNANLDSWYGQIVSGIGKARGIPEAQVRELIDKYPGTAPEALDAGLLDGIKYLDELLDQFLPGDRKGRVITEERYRLVGPESLGLNKGPKVAVVYAVGAIQTGENAWSPAGSAIGAATAVKEINAAAQDKNVQAIILRVDSPGGSSLASDMITAAVIKAKEKKPVIASMSDDAASGGYHISSNASAIVAQPGTRTGAIGVWSVRPSFHGLLQKIGVNTVTIHRGKNALIDSMTTDSTKEWADLLQRSVEYDYNMFITKVARGRHTTREAIDKVGRGRAWTGELASGIGLVDKLGGFPEAIALLNEKLGRPSDAEVELVFLRPRKGLWELIKEITDQGSGADLVPVFGDLPASGVKWALWHPGELMEMEPMAQ